VHDPKLAAQPANETKNIIFSHGRQSLTDPEWPNKAGDGKIGDLKRRLRCNIRCMLRYDIRHAAQLPCVINEEMGYENHDTAIWPKGVKPGKYRR